MFFYIKISSKDKEVLTKFSWFLLKLETSAFTLKSFPRKNTKKFITILKSPHVNKTAQEQFEFRFYNKSFLIHSFQPFVFLFLLKKLKNLSFSGLNLEIKSLFKYNEKIKKTLKLSDPDNFIVPSSKISDKLYLKNLLLKKYIQSFDFYGENFLRQFSKLMVKGSNPLKCN